ncbi:MAG: TIGR03617 family F420-dependent LLM class oxidoreductase [Thaumarchaeota archaeon]|nr:TIGR03617 family F420-dependent LLM class oxidoreductase [Nitrososphaerota archaeon]
MKIDVELMPDLVSEVPRLAERAEELGFDGLWVNETKHDAFVQVALAAANTERLAVGTAIALAFTRSPTALAYAAWDIQSIAGGRFVLGLGSQVKGHIERRFGTVWVAPGSKMREVVQILRILWKNWQTGEPVDFDGKHFKINLMTPFFSPPPLARPVIPIFLAGVNPRMCRLAGELGDGLHVHPLHSVKYLKEVVIKAVSEGLRKSGRDRTSLVLAGSVFFAAGNNDKEIRKMKQECRKQISFYASTRTYRPVLEEHGWGDVCDRLHEKSMKGLWSEMASEITDDMLEEFVIEGTWDEILNRVKERYVGILDRVRLYFPFDDSPSWRTFARGLKEPKNTS